MKAIKILLTLLALIAATGAAWAQKAIDDEIRRIEKSGKANIVYQEKRNVTTKQVYKVTYVITLQSDNDIKRIEKAFEKERGNTSSATRAYQMINYKFMTKDFSGDYMLRHDNNGHGTLIVTKKYYNRYPNSADADREDLLDMDIEPLPMSMPLSSLREVEPIDFSMFINPAATLNFGSRVYVSPVPVAN